MFSLRVVPMVLLVCTFLLAVYLTLLGSGVLGQPSLDVKPVSAGQQEIAWLMPATSGTNWERLVAAAIHLREQWPKIYPHSPRLLASFDNAFPKLTAEVPELAIYLEGREHEKLWIRWYKLSSNLDIDAWITRLAARTPAPLAIMGGDNSDRALTIARTLHAKVQSWRGASHPAPTGRGEGAPLFLLTTATADRYFPEEIREADLTLDTWPKLMDVYQGRSFRFSFTNSRMARTVIRFVSDHPGVWSHDERDWAAFAGAVGLANPWSCLATLAHKRYINPIFLYTLAWRDDRYSLDLADRFSRVFAERYYEGRERLARQNTQQNNIPYGVGDYFHPNPREAQAAGMFLTHNRQFKNQHQVLVLPTSTQRARRFLRTLCRMAPREMDNVVVVSGDSIDFNPIYRDRDLAWNILDIPVPLVFFSHRNPVDATAGFVPAPVFGAGAAADLSKQSGTQDLLLNSDMLTAIAQAVFQGGQLLGDANEFERRLRETVWRDGHVANPAFTLDSPGKASGGRGIPLFDADGDRNNGTGEHIVWVKPMIDGGQTLMRATITVWSHEDDTWREAGPPLTVLYHSSVDPGNAAP